MWNFKDFNKSCKTRAFEWLSDRLLSSGHFRRTVLRRLFTKYGAPGALVYVTFPDHALVVDPRDHMIAFNLMSGKCWQRQELEQALEISELAGALKPGGWFIDVGANIGTQTLYALLSGKFRGVVAIEPEPRNIALLKRNVALNGFTDRVHIVEAAASAHSGTAELKRDLQNFGAHTIEPQQPLRRTDTISVKTRPIDDILADLGIAAADVGQVMIDVEGHEIDALRGMPMLRRRGVPIVVEVNGELHGAAGAAQLRALLAADYDMIAPLSSKAGKDTGASDQPLAGFDFGLRQSDVLIYKRASTTGAG